MLFKILHGDASRISTDITPFHEGYCYVTYDGSMYVDMNLGTETAPNNKRVQLNAKNALTSIEAQALINQNNGEKVQLWVGTQAELDAIEERDENCVYFTTDEIDFDPNDVLLVTEQELTEEQKAQARANIGAVYTQDYVTHNMITEGMGLSISYLDYLSGTNGYVSVDSHKFWHVSYSVVNINDILQLDEVMPPLLIEYTNYNTAETKMLEVHVTDHTEDAIYFETDNCGIFCTTKDNVTANNNVVFPKKGVYVANLIEMVYVTGIYILCHDFRNGGSVENSNLPSDFLTSGASDTVTWDGNTDGLERVDGETNGMYYYKIPNVKHNLTLEDFSQGVTAVTRLVMNGEVDDHELLVDSSDITIEQHPVLGEVYNIDNGAAYLSETGDVYLVYTGGASSDGAVNMYYIPSLTINGCSDAFQTPVINKDYLPSHTHTLNDLPITFSTVDLEDGVSTLPAGTI